MKLCKVQNKSLMTIERNVKDGGKNKVTHDTILVHLIMVRPKGEVLCFVHFGFLKD